MTRRLRGCLPGVSCRLAAASLTAMGLAASLAASALAVAHPARAQDIRQDTQQEVRGMAAERPLFLRIRPQMPASLGGGGSAALSGDLADAEIARQARAAREAVWERAAARARIAIASVCTGCLRPEPQGAAPARNAAEEPRRNAVGARSGAQAENRPAPASLAALADRTVPTPPEPALPESVLPEPATRGDP
ncbi:hypothetical protein [Methylobacterium soli]|uniref:hypothetical protein n=1 Tax=Methylobacterium soli TaxID=553447 RepID=UPI001EE2AE3D|nr:hypothetical protein [Methylobacterium soli]GJE45158.1 hypothetical protein AEGHOMDF_4352 [Methylobacterium soli]